MKQRYFLGLDSKSFHRIAYLEWGKPNSQPIICVHGVTRNAHDFDCLAKRLAELNFYVTCPDVPGRGNSDWLTDPRDYGFPVYLADMTALIARLNAEQVGWIGTSMGGVIGMLLAALPQSPIQYLVLNDIGPFIHASALERIKANMDLIVDSLVFSDINEVNSYFQRVLSSFGILNTEQWQQMIHSSIKQLANGRYALKIDPAVKTHHANEKQTDINLWHIWHAIRCPVLVIHGTKSDILLPDVIAEMKKTNPNCESVDIPNVGHAPALMSDEQIAYITNWLAKVTKK